MQEILIMNEICSGNLGNLVISREINSVFFSQDNENVSLITIGK